MFIPSRGFGAYCPACAETARKAEEAAERDKLAKRKAQAERDELARRMAAEVEGIPAKYRSANFKNCDPNNPAVAAAISWAKEPKGVLIIYGKCGRGKTYLAAAVKKALNLTNRKSGFYCEDEILITIKSAFNPAAKMTEGEAYGLFAGDAPLIIDDLGASRVSEFTLDTWEIIIGTRYREERPTLITTNYDPTIDPPSKDPLALFPRIGIRAVERIRESKMMFELGGANRRTT
jgi:DNA replication protein DnaC